MSEVEKSVQEHYDNFGWVVKGGRSGEDESARRFRPPYYKYSEGATRRTLECFSDIHGRLLIAGQGDLPNSHIEMAEKFSEVWCVDISRLAMQIAEEKIGINANYVQCSILDLPFSGGYFDAIYCAHVLYHIDKDLQKKAVQELVRVARAGGKVVVVYHNPGSPIRSIVSSMNRVKRWLRVIRDTLKPAANKVSPGISDKRPDLYFAPHPLRWWFQFETTSDVRFLPWAVMGAKDERMLLWTDSMASVGYRIAAWCEKKYPEWCVKIWRYVIIILEKHPPD